MAEGVDYSSTRPNPQQLYAAGKRFVVRYGGPGGDWKHLTAAEAASLTGAGLALVANGEGAADGLLGGWDVGVLWARSAGDPFRLVITTNPDDLRNAAAAWDEERAPFPSVKGAISASAL
jgi:hypothetical protein